MCYIDDEQSIPSTERHSACYSFLNIVKFSISYSKKLTLNNIFKIKAHIQQKYILIVLKYCVIDFSCRYKARFVSYTPVLLFYFLVVKWVKGNNIQI